MPIAILIAVLLGYGYLLISLPEYRRHLLLAGVVAAALVAILLYLNPSESTNRTSRVSPDELVIDQIEFVQTGRGATVTGRVQNTSDTGHIREIVLDMRLYDCPIDYSELTECLITGDSTAIARPDIPPRQTRGFTARFVFANLPTLSGVLTWTLTPSEVGATRAGE